MNRTMPNLPNRIEELRTQLHGVEDPREQLPILLELSSQLVVIDSTEAEEFARRALDIAVEIDEKCRIAESWVKLSLCLGVQAQYDRAIHYLRKAWNLHHHLPAEPYTKMTISLGLGRSYYQHGNIRAALKWIERSFGFAEESNSLRAVGSCYGVAGSIYRSLGQYGKALECMVKARGAYESLSNVRGLALLEWDLGVIYSGIRDWDSAILQYEKSLVLNREVGDRQLQGLIYKGLGIAYTVKGQYKKALKLYRRAYALFERLKDVEQMSQTLSRVGYVHLYQYQSDAAYESFCQVLEMLDTIGSKAGRSYVLVGLGLVHLDREEWQAAIDLITPVMMMERTSGGVLMMRDVHWILAEAHEQLGNVSVALKHHKRYVEFEHALLNDHVSAKLRTMEMWDGGKRNTEGREIPKTKIKQLKRAAGKYSAELNVASVQLAQSEDLLGNLRERLVELKNSKGANRKAIDSLLRQIQGNADRMSALRAFEEGIRKHDHAYAHMLHAIYTSLTPTELRICTLLKVGLSNQEIVDLLNVSSRTIDRHRTTIRKKLGLVRSQNLIDFLVQIDRKKKGTR